MTYKPPYYESYPEAVGYDNYYDDYYFDEMSGVKIRRRDTTKGPPLRILSLGTLAPRLLAKFLPFLC